MFVIVFLTISSIPHPNELNTLMKSVITDFDIKVYNWYSSKFV